MQIKKTQIEKRIFLSMLFTVCPVGSLLAQTKPLIPPLAQAKPTQATLSQSGTTAMTTSAPLLSSPFLSPTAKERLRQDQLALDQAFALVKTGDDLAKNGDWQHAQDQYQQALDLSPNYGLGHQLALYGLIAYCRATGDTTKGLNYSRQAIYCHGSAAEGFSENDTAKLMQFALLLNRTGQTAEAVQVYNRAAYALDYRDSEYHEGKPYLKVLLPEVVVESPLPGQMQYTPEHLQAMADTALAHEEMGFGSDKEATAHMQEAVKLCPDLPVTHYYLGEALLTKDNAGAKAEYQKAAELGDDKTAMAVKERLKVLR